LLRRASKRLAMAGIRRLISREEGFSLLSVLVSVAILGVVIAPATYLVESATALNAEGRREVTASNLAQSELQILEAQGDRSFQNLVNQVGTTTYSRTIGPTSYTVSTTLYWTQGTTDPSGCSANSSSQQSLEPTLSATVEVTWTNMAPFTPARATTAFHVPVGYTSPGTGAVLVVVQNQLGNPDEGIPVTLASSGNLTTTTVTDAQGCAYFPFLSPGSYSASITSPISGQVWTDPLGDASPSVQLSVGAGDNAQADFTYAQAATLDLVPPGTNVSVPWPLGVSIGSTSLPGGETRFLAGPGPLDDVFPAPSGYQVWLGQCYLYTSFPGTSLGSVAAPAPGQTVNANLLGQIVDLTVTANGAPVAGASVSLTETSSTGTPLAGCVDGPTAVVGTTNASGSLSFLAPIGWFTLAVTTPQGQTSTYPSTGAVQAPGGAPLDVTIAD